MFILYFLNSVRKTIKSKKNLKETTRKFLYNSSNKAFAELPVAVMSAALIGTMILTSAAGYNLYNGATKKVSQLRMARALAADEAERIRSAGYDDIIKIEKPDGKLQSGYVREVALGKEYREDIGNSVLKHKPVTINIYDSQSSYFPLVSIRTEKVSRWYKSGTFDKSEGGIYDETGEQHNGSIKKTGSGTGYVFLKKGAKVNGDVEIYDETNGDIYIYNSIGTPGKKTVIRHVGPATASGYIRLAESCTIDGTVTLENSSNGGMILANKIPKNAYIKKLGNGTGYLNITSTANIGQNITVTNNSAGAVIINKTFRNNCNLLREGNSDGTLLMNGYIYGNITINMQQSGKIETVNSWYEGTTLNYISTTNKKLTISGDRIKKPITIKNNSQGNISYYADNNTETTLIYSGNGNGKLSLTPDSTTEGLINIINDTAGNIIISTNLKNNNITKTGEGVGELRINTHTTIAGNFTLFNDGDGFFRVSGRIDPVTGTYQFPYLADNSFIKITGGNYGGVLVYQASDILGKVYLDYTEKPNEYTILGGASSSDPTYRYTFPDGYTKTYK